MPRVNLIREIDNIRNRLRPEKKKYLFTFSKGLLAVVFLAGVYWFVSDERKISPEPSIQAVTNSVKPPSPTSIKKEEKKKIVVAPKPKPKPEPAPAPVASRPVGLPVKREKPTAKSEERWRIRFGVFVYEEYSRAFVSYLGEKGILAQVVEGWAPIDTQRVVYGPWPTDSQAKDEKKRLDREGITTSRFMAGEKKYLSTKPLKDAKEAERLRLKGEKLGLKAEISMKKETRRVFRVYKKGGYLTREEAEEDQKRIAKNGVENIIEQIQKDG